MGLVDARTGLAVIDPDTCRALLAGEEIGRLALVVGRAPAIFPLNYALDGDAVVFRTAPGTKLDHAERGPVAFEVDGLDREQRTGWSVVVHGRLEEVTQFDAATLARVSALALYPWAEGVKDHWLRLVPSHISGRRVVHHAGSPPGGKPG
jgi:nitroimidazol reductase NimA-like FMN-containing flavoprotein (pyridoxamine 5'-phosphate oxidase superfamily)